MRKFLIASLVAAILGCGAVAQAHLRPLDRVVKIPAPLQWNTQSAAHLMRRAGFSGSPDEIQHVVDQGFNATLTELLQFENVDDSAMEAGLAAENYPLTRMNQNDVLNADPLGMNHWWLYRMINSKRQLLEKLTFFWHDHFATSVAEIRFVDKQGIPLMIDQNQTLRQHALGNFKEMVRAIARDPAMLIWLDNFTNVKAMPNENWARELLELFTMGVDQYTQEDVEQAARAFTGWTLDRRDLTFVFNQNLHDFGEKTFLGQTGNFDGDDIIDIVFEQDVTAKFIARKLWEFLVCKDPSDELVSELARVFRESGYEIKPLVSAILRHPEFYSPKAYRALMKSPVELVVNFMREAELVHPDFTPFFTNQMNQLLFAPPDVGGWTSGVGWVNTSTLLIRYNYFNTFITYRGNGGAPPRPDQLAPDPIDLAAIIQKYNLTLASEVVDHFAQRLIQEDLPPDTSNVLEEYLNKNDSGVDVGFDITNPVTVDKKVRGLLYLMTLLPVYQLN